LRGRLDDIHAAGVELVFVGNGAVPFARNFLESEVPGSEVYTDPSRESYLALGMRRGLAGVLGPHSLVAGMRARRAGFRQHGVEGDPLQLGGFFAVEKGGRIVYAQVHSSAGDRPDVDAALRSLTAQVGQSGHGGGGSR
jgi:AhpC/TSA antioxidant enzyme